MLLHQISCTLSNPQWQQGILNGCEAKRMAGGSKLGIQAGGSELIHWTVFSLLVVFSVDLNVLCLVM